MGNGEAAGAEEESAGADFGLSDHRKLRREPFMKRSILSLKEGFWIHWLQIQLHYCNLI